MLQDDELRSGVRLLSYGVPSDLILGQGEIDFAHRDVLAMVGQHRLLINAVMLALSVSFSGFWRLI
jgi:hypothetical protein